MMRKIREVRKRDNRVVPFDEAKIADAIYRAIRSVGEGDQSLSEELAAAVVHFLESRFEGSIPGIEDIQDLVETVLMEMGHPSVAKAYILYRQKRAMLRETLEVRKVAPHGEGVSFDYADESVRGPPPLTRSSIGEGEPSNPTERPLGASTEEIRLAGDGALPSGEFPQVDEGVLGTSFWCKSKISAALIREADLDPDVAEEIAASVEGKVLRSGIRRLSTSLIRELVDNELFERGFCTTLERQVPIGLPKYNLEQIIFGTDSKEGYTFPKNPAEVREIISNRILHQYSLQEVFSPAVADAHREGRLFLHRLSDPMRVARLHWRLPPPAPVSGGRLRGPDDAARGSPTNEPGDLSYVDVGDFVRLFVQLGTYVSEEVRLGNLPHLFLAPSLRGLSARESVQTVLERLSQIPARPDLVLELDLDSSSEPWLRGLIDLAGRRPRRFRIALCVRPVSAAERGLLSLVVDLYGRGELVEFVVPRFPEAGTPSVAGSRSIGGGRSESLIPARGTDGLVVSGTGGSQARAATSEVFANETRVSRAGLSATLAKITINLPRAAYRSGMDRRSSIEAELDAALDLAVKAHLERRQFVGRLASNRENPLWGLLGRPDGTRPILDLEENTECSIGILGLNECVKFLTGKELHQDKVAGRKALELARALDAKLRREARGLGIRLRLEETANRGPLRVLEQVDRQLYPQIAEIDRGRRNEALASYTDGVRFHRLAPVDPLRRLEELAPFLSSVLPAGSVVEDCAELRGPDHEVLVSLLEEGIPYLCRQRRAVSPRTPGGVPATT